jgi:hypothetical protein
MSATTSPSSKVSFSTSISANPAKHPGMAVRRGSQNYVEAQQAASAAGQSPIEIPDGRRNSQGEALKSPVASWKPSFERTQSWNQQDLKREVQKGELSKADGAAGFTESEATRD